MLPLRQRFVVLFFTIWLFALAPSSGGAQMLTGYEGQGAYVPDARTISWEQAAVQANDSVTVYPLEPAPEYIGTPVPDVARDMVPAPQRPGPSYAQASIYRSDRTPSLNYKPELDKETPVDLAADNLRHDEDTGEIRATGNVELVQGQRILRADMVSYNLNTDVVSAQGNVSLTEPNGDVHFADEVRLENEMKTGFIKGVQSYMAEGGRFTAELAERVNDRLIRMTNAAYTPCDCETDEDGNPVWQIKAKEVEIDEVDHQVRYKDAKFEIYGTPVAWTPYLSHPDGKVKRKSGFLSPGVGFDSELGLSVTQNYYWDIAPNKDATIGALITSKEAPVALGQYRHRFEHADFQIEGSATYSSRNDSIGGVEVITDDEFRGHVFADGLWNINNKWRSGLNVEVSTDDQYLRQYDFSSKDVLENELYVERFSGRNYAVGRFMAFQDTRVEEEQTDQPNILPEVEVSFIGEPNKTLGGRWEAKTSALALHRNDGQDMTRLVGQAGWKRRDVTNVGVVSDLALNVRGDAYFVNDRDIAQGNTGRSNDGEATRFFPQAHWTASYPLVKPMERMQAVIEPVVSLTAAPDIDVINSDIPNEDSQDVQLDASNLYEANRFPGYDRLEDESRATYGVRSGLYGYGGSYGDVFIGQSYRLDDDDSPFPNGSGLERQESDWVGQVAGMYDNRYGVNYRFQLQGNDFNSRRHEVDAFADFGRLDLSSRYLFAKALEGTDIDESREQIYGGAAFDLTNNWRVRGSVLEDLGANPGLREATLGVDYFGCCLSFSATVERNITSDVSGDSGTAVKFRVGLKGLGEFETNDSGSVSGSNRR